MKSKGRKGSWYEDIRTLLLILELATPETKYAGNALSKEIVQRKYKYSLHSAHATSILEKKNAARERTAICC